jgi:hypothetical protein
MTHCAPFQTIVCIRERIIRRSVPNHLDPLFAKRPGLVPLAGEIPT